MRIKLRPLRNVYNPRRINNCMNNNTPTPLAVSRREKENHLRKQAQQSEMDANRVQQTTRTVTPQSVHQCP